MNYLDGKPKVIFHFQTEQSRDDFDAKFSDYLDVFYCQDSQTVLTQLSQERNIVALILDEFDRSHSASSNWLSEAKANHENCLIVLLSNEYDMASILAILTASPIDQCLKKPVDIHALLSNIYASSLIRERGKQGKEEKRKISTQQKPLVLLVDDEEVATRYLKKQLLHIQSDYDIETAIDVAHAQAILAKKQVAVVISDQRMPGVTGQAFLSQLKHNHPHTIRILTSAYEEVDVALGAINESKIFYYLTKPWSADKINEILTLALEAHQRLKQEAIDNQTKIVDTHQSLISARIDTLKEKLSDFIAAPIIADFLADLTKLNTQSPNSASVKVSTETDLEQALLDQFIDPMRSAVLQIEQDLCPRKAFIQGLTDYLAQQYPNSHKRRPTIDLFCRALEDLKQASGNGIHFRCELNEDTLTIRNHGELKLYKSLASPLTQLSAKLLSYQSSLLILYIIVSIYSGRVIISGIDQGFNLLIQLPTADQEKDQVN